MSTRRAGRLRGRSQAESDATAALKRYAFLCAWEGGAWQSVGCSASAALEAQRSATIHAMAIIADTTRSVRPLALSHRRIWRRAVRRPGGN